MISTITTTVTVVTLAAGGTLGALATVFLIFLLAAKEIIIADRKRSLRVFGRSLNIGILPLLIIFALFVTFKVIEAL